MPEKDYRTRVYEHYVHARQHSLAPNTIQGLTPRAPYLKSLIAKHFPTSKNAVILDLGCGHGALVHFAKQAGYCNVKGIDRSREQVKAGHSLGINEIVEGDLKESLEMLPRESVDLVVAFDVIEHFTKSELLIFVDNVHRVLRKGGKWIIHTPNGESPFAGRMRYWDITHELAFTRESISQLLKVSGFETVVCDEDQPVPHGLVSFARWTIWKLIRACLRFYIAVETGSIDKDCVFTQNFLTVATK